MSWEAPQALGGPVLEWELARATRHSWPKYLQGGYAAFIIVECLLLFAAFTSPRRAMRIEESTSNLELRQALYTQRAEFLDGYLLVLLQQQLLFLVLLIPALTAGSLGQEKERGTLFALFGTELTAWQIILGKLLGRLALVIPLALTSLPALVFVAVVNERALVLLLVALAQEVVLAFTLGSACFLFAIWIRRASDAILACYAILCFLYLVVRSLLVALPLARWLDPAQDLRILFAQESKDALGAFLLHLAAWSGVGVACLVLAATRLRRACLEQTEKKPSRRLWAFRPRVGDNPIRWRERYVIGLAPLPFLRVVPRWLALLGVFAVSSVVAALAVDSISPGFVDQLLVGHFTGAFADLDSREKEVGGIVPIMGMTFIFLAEILVGVRCGTSVAEEKRRNTWDDLLLTAQSFSEITRSKMWGVLEAALPYVVVYAVPVFVVAAQGGQGAVTAAAFWVVLPCVVVFVAALAGMEMLRVPPEMDETREGGAFHFEPLEARQMQRRKAKRWEE